MNSYDLFLSALKAHVCTLFGITEQELASAEYILNVDEQRQAFGDCSCNLALLLAKQLKSNPRAIATKIAETFKHELVEKIEIAGPGFLNFFFTQTAYTKLLQELYEQKENFFKPDGINKQRYNVEFVSANPTGPLHLGHGRGGILGDVIGNILRFAGHHVTKEFYINDAGNQINILGDSFKARCLQELGESATVPENGYQGQYLVELAQACVKKFGKELKNKPDKFFADYAKNELRAQQERTLAQYGIHFDVWFSEKTLHESGNIDRAIEKLKTGNYVYEQDGALWFKATEFGDDKDRVIRKTTGEWTYVAPDIAYMLEKAARGADHLIFILGHDHHSYADRLKALKNALGMTQDLDVVLYQLVQIKEGGQQVRMSKRTGKMVELQDVIDTVGADVARFFYLQRKADAQLEIDLDLALKKTEENPVYYLQYAFVRINSVLKKAAGIPEFKEFGPEDAQHLTEHERILIRKIAALKSLINVMCATYQTHQLTYYTLELAQLLHGYYNRVKVLDQTHPEQSRARLLVIKQVHETLGMTFGLMGISKPEQM